MRDRAKAARSTYAVYLGSRPKCLKFFSSSYTSEFTANNFNTVIYINPYTLTATSIPYNAIGRLSYIEIANLFLRPNHSSRPSSVSILATSRSTTSFPIPSPRHLLDFRVPVFDDSCNQPSYYPSTFTHLAVSIPYDMELSRSANLACNITAIQPTILHCFS